MPVADIETIAHAQRMVATRRRPIFPGIRLAAGLPLAGNPPPGDLDRLGRIGEVQDHYDVAHAALRGRRDVGIAAIEIIAVDAAYRKRRRWSCRAAPPCARCRASCRQSRPDRRPGSPSATRGWCWTGSALATRTGDSTLAGAAGAQRPLAAPVLTPT